MTDEMAIQGQRPSAMPYVLGGVAAGGAAGALATMGNVGFKTPAYSSWDAAVADVNKDDSFVKKQIEKGGDNKASWEEIKNQAEAIKAKEKAVKDLNLGEGVKAEDFKALADKEIALEQAKQALVDKENAAFKTELENLKKMEIQADKPYEYGGKGYNQEEFRKLLNSTEEGDKQIVEKLVKDTNGYKEAIGKEDFAKAEKEAITKAEEAVTKAKEGLSENAKKVSEELRKSAVDALKDVEAAKNTAKEKLSEELLGKCKKASGWRNALAGAVVLGLAGLLVRPKGDEAMEA